MPNEPTSAPFPASDTAPALVSLVLPVYNEAPAMPELHRRLTEVMRAAACEYEIIFVDDGSSDDTLSALKTLAEKDPHVAAVALRRNFGQTPALAAGFDIARGEVIVALDADLENLPEDIPRLLQKLAEGYDVVSGWRQNRQHGLLLRRLPSQIANRMMCRMTGLELHDFGCTLKAYRTDMLRQVRLYGEMHRFIPVLAHIEGAKIAELPVGHVDRPYGKSHYGISRTFRVFMDILLLGFLLKFRSRPGHPFGMAAAASFALAALTAFYTPAAWFFNHTVGRITFNLPRLSGGVGFTLFVMFVLAGAVFIGMGLTAELITRAWHESSGRKIYAIRKVYRKDGA